VLRDTSLIDTYSLHYALPIAAREVAQGDAFLTKVGMLSVFAAVQAKHGPPHLPHLCGWLARELEPALTRFHGKTMRDQMRKRLRSEEHTSELTSREKLVCRRF